MHKVVVWDRVGNVTWGVQPWHELDLRRQAFLLAEDADARSHAPSLAELFAGHEVDIHFVRTVEELDEAIGDAEFLIVHKYHVPPEVLRKGDRLRLVQHLGWDYRGIPVETAREMGVPVAATPLVNYLAVAEHAWALILSHLKRLNHQRTYMQERAYMEEGWGIVPGVRMARDLTLGLLGFGEIGRPMAQIANAFGMRVLYWDIAHFPEIEERHSVVSVSWEDVFSQSDILSVHLALNEQTEGIIGRREFGLMKRDALFVNTARGKLVDQAALADALRFHRIGGAALDVYAEEPLPADDPLHALHEDPRYNVTLTPHTAWQGPWTHVRDSLEIWYNVLRVLDGEPVQHLVG